MKTMKRNDDILRVSEDKVEKQLSMGYTFCTKKVWKTEVRDADKKADEPEKEKKVKKEKK